MDDRELYVYRVTEVVKVVDGDTFDLIVDPASASSTPTVSGSTAGQTGCVETTGR